MTYILKSNIMSACGDYIIITLDFVKIKGKNYNSKIYAGLDIEKHEIKAPVK